MFTIIIVTKEEKSSKSTCCKLLTLKQPFVNRKVRNCTLHIFLMADFLRNMLLKLNIKDVQLCS